MKKLFSVVLAICMIFSCLTVFSFAKTTYKVVWNLSATANGKAYYSDDTITVKPGDTVSVTLRVSNNYKTGPIGAIIYYTANMFEDTVPYAFNKDGAMYKTCGGQTSGFTDWTKIHESYKTKSDFWPNYSDAAKLESFKNTYHFATMQMTPNAAVSRTPALNINEDLVTMTFKVNSKAANGSTGSILIPVECMRSKSNPGGRLYCGIFKTDNVAGELLQYSEDQTFDCSGAVLNFKVSTGGSSYNLGDVNKDSKINSTDSLLILQYTVGSKTLTDEQKTLGDVNKDSKLNSSDALKILQYTVGQIKSF